ncbi:MAG: arsenite methyltransferase [Ktedonobacteraceae bacterium]|nr:arsenite methyltransferase [Ktedonobacteraceae bacterium]
MLHPQQSGRAENDCSSLRVKDKQWKLKKSFREKYSQAAVRVQSRESSCCGAAAALDSCSPITSNLYDASQTDALPEKALLASLGCGNPTALAKLNAGETGLDLGSGGGIDVLLSARRVGPTAKAYGLDRTDEMLALARENQRKAGIENVEFLKGEIEHIPLPENSVDVVISNCVINLSADKDHVLRETFRVLKPGGRFAVSDVVTRGAVPDEVRKACCYGSAAWRGRLRMKSTKQSWRERALRPSKSNRRAFTTSRTRELSFPVRASMSMLLRRRWKENL